MLLFWQAANWLSERVMESILKLFVDLFKVITNNFTVLRGFAACIPTSVRLMRSRISFNRDDFTRYVMCPKCGKLYSIADITGEGRITKCTRGWVRGSVRCERLFKCNAKLIKEVKLANGCLKVYPLKTFCYNSVIEATRKLRKRPGVFKSCMNWRELRAPHGYMSVVYDNNIWQLLF